MKTSSKKTDSYETKVIAVTSDADKIRAVMLQKEVDSYQLVWAKSCDANQVDFQKFVNDCISNESGDNSKADGKDLIIGFDSSMVFFHRLDIPAVRQQEIDNIVRLQTEARLPLAANQVELDWSAMSTGNGQLSVTVAIARKQQLEKFAENTNRLKPKEILLDNEGIVQSWRQFFYGSDQPALLVSIERHNTKICTAENGRLTNSASIDIGMKDCSATDSAEQSETIERFAQDIRNLLNSFGYTEPRQLAVFILSNGNKIIEQVVTNLTAMGLDVRTVLPNLQKIKTDKTLAAEKIDEIYEYRTPVGLASIALEKDKQHLNLFKNLYKPSGKEKTGRLINNLKVMTAFVAIMLILLVVVCYFVDVANLKAIEKSLESQNSQTSFKSILEKQQLVKTVARNRPDLLNLLSQLNPQQAQGVRLDSLDFKKGKPVNIKGLADNSDQLYKFQKTLLDKKDISDVKIQSVSKEPKGNKLRFSITFSYRNFSKRIS